MLAQSPRSYALQVFGASSNQDPLLDVYSPTTYISPDDPPFLIMHGDQDPLVPYGQSVLLYEALRRMGADVVFHTLPGAGHGGPAFDDPAIRAIVEAFFDRVLGPPPRP